MRPRNHLFFSHASSLNIRGNLPLLHIFIVSIPPPPRTRFLSALAIVRVTDILLFNLNVELYFFSKKKTVILGGHATAIKVYLSLRYRIFFPITQVR